MAVTQHVGFDAPVPRLLRTFVWGLMVMGYSQWLNPSNLTMATYNLGDKVPFWASALPYGVVFLAPAVELLVHRSQPRLTLQILSGLFFLFAAALLKASDRLSGTWLPISLAAAMGTVVTQMGFAHFIDCVPAEKRCSRLFVAMLGVALVPIVWTGVFLRLPRSLSTIMPWTDAWATVIAIIGLLALVFAWLSRSGLSATSSNTNPVTRLPLESVYPRFLEQFFRKRGLAWVIAFLFGYVLACSALVDTVLQRFSAFDEAPNAFFQKIGVVTSLFGTLGVLAYPLTARFGLKRSFRPLVVGTALAPTFLAFGILVSSTSQRLLLIVLSLQSLFGTAFMITWMLYAIGYVARRQFVLGNYAWLTALIPAFTFGTRFVTAQHAIRFGDFGIAYLLLGGVALMLATCFKLPFDEDTLR